MNPQMKKMNAVAAILKSAPGLVCSEESINQLVMKDNLDIATGSILLSNMASNESYVDNAGTMPTISAHSTEAVALINATLSVSTEEDLSQFFHKVSELNSQFQLLYKKARADLTNGISAIAELTDKDAKIANGLVNELKADEHKIVLC